MDREIWINVERRKRRRGAMVEGTTKGVGGGGGGMEDIRLCVNEPKDG